MNGLSSNTDDEPQTSTSADEDEDDIYLLAKSYFDLKVMLHSKKATNFSPF